LLEVQANGFGKTEVKLTEQGRLVLEGTAETMEKLKGRLFVRNIEIVRGILALNTKMDIILQALKVK
jgi:hypothetical protein